MNLFLDTSVLVKLFQAENGTRTVIDWVNNARKVVLLDLTRLEFQSALQRLLRNQDLRRDDNNLLQQGFREKGRILLTFNRLTAKSLMKLNNCLKITAVDMA